MEEKDAKHQNQKDEVPAVVPSHRRVENGLTTVEIAISRLSHKAGGCRVRVDA